MNMTPFIDVSLGRGDFFRQVVLNVIIPPIKRNLPQNSLSSGLQTLQDPKGGRLENRIKAIVVDLMLPGLSGSELIEEIRRSSRTPVIVLSAKTELSDKVELLGLVADDYLTKPLSRKSISSPPA